MLRHGKAGTISATSPGARADGPRRWRSRRALARLTAWPMTSSRLRRHRPRSGCSFAAGIGKTTRTHPRRGRAGNSAEDCCRREQSRSRARWARGSNRFMMPLGSMAFALKHHTCGGCRQRSRLPTLSSSGWSVAKNDHAFGKFGNVDSCVTMTSSAPCD